MTFARFLFRAVGLHSRSGMIGRPAQLESDGLLAVQTRSVIDTLVLLPPAQDRFRGLVQESD